METRARFARLSPPAQRVMLLRLIRDGQTENDLVQLTGLSLTRLRELIAQASNFEENSVSELERPS